MKIKNVEIKIFYLLLIIGVLSRLFLVVKLPIWHDEFYSIWASGHTISEIVLSLTDNVHPPGYYLFLHFWGIVSQHLYWFRLSSVIFFVINIFLFKKIAETFKKPNSPNLLIFLYVFSGYFLIFDWQVRMYTLIVTLILLSLIMLLKLKGKALNNNRTWFGYTLINFLGLYIDYSFIWYFVPAAIFTLIYFAIKKDKRFWNLFYSYFLSCLFLLLVFPSIFIRSQTGINGITWITSFMSPSFFVPFFLGSHVSLFFTFIFLILFLFGLYELIKTRATNFTTQVIIFSAVSSTIGTLIFSKFATPLFHVRSLQIVGLMILLIYYFGLTSVQKVFTPYLFVVMILWFLSNFVLVNNIIINSPGRVLIMYFPWRNILNSTDIKGVNTIKYKIVYKLPTPLLLYGLEYTLNGNENIDRPSIKMEKYNETDDNSNCNKFDVGLMELYKCK